MGENRGSTSPCTSMHCTLPSVARACLVDDRVSGRLTSKTLIACVKPCQARPRVRLRHLSKPAGLHVIDETPNAALVRHERTRLDTRHQLANVGIDISNDSNANGGRIQCTGDSRQANASSPHSGQRRSSGGAPSHPWWAGFAEHNQKTRSGGGYRRSRSPHSGHVTSP
jgi:hypothetical protein